MASRDHLSINIGDPRLPAWFWNRVIPEPNSGCWLWLGSINGDGYGQYGRGTPGNMRPLVHRISIGALEPLIKGLTVDHLCQVRCCVNPQHLEQVTAAENTHRIQLRASRCTRGHLHTPANTRTYVMPTDTGGQRIKRICRACDRARHERNLAKAKSTVNA